MRPVCAPNDAIVIRRDQRLGERDGIGIVGRQLGSTIAARDFHVGLARIHQLHQIGKAGLFYA